MKHHCPLGILLDLGQYANDKRNTYACSVSYHCPLGVILFYRIVFTLRTFTPESCMHIWPSMG
jgi:hypothetical protein